MYCKYCGAEIEEGLVFCKQCGKVAVDPVAPEQAVENKPTLNVGMLVWSIINMVICCQPAGIIAFVFTLLAKYEEKVKSDKYIGVAKICNIVGTVYGALTIVVSVFIFIYFFAMIISLASAAAGSAAGGAIYY